MPLRLAHQLALLLAAAVLLTTLALGGLAAWNLRSGFGDYLRAQDERWLQRFAELAAQSVQRDGLAAISGGPGVLRPLIDTLRDESRPPRGPGPRDDFARAPPPPTMGDGLGPPRRGPRPEGGFGGFGGGGGGGDPRRYGPRLALLTPDGQLLGGRPLEDARGALRQPIVVDGKTIAVAWLREGPPVDDAVDAAFLTRQYAGLIAAALAAAALAVAVALLVARRWVRPLLDAQAAARRIAGGEFDVRLATGAAGSVELVALAESINAMAASLATLEGSRRRWIAELSHELRTPLAVLRAEVEALQDGLRRPDAAALASLHAEVQRLARLADDFHQLALSDLRALPVRLRRLDPLLLVRQAVQRLLEPAAARGLALVLVEPAPLPELHASWDADRIAQLLANLLHNSLRYTDAPGRIELALRHDAADGALELTLDDGAPGVPEAERPRLFEPLYRADAARTRDAAGGGSGLGLAICRAIVTSHGGTIEAAASPLGGLRIVVRLPLQPGAAR